MARRANYSATGLARLSGLSVRQLEREFRRTIFQSPKRWLNGLRLCAARKALLQGGSVKETAFSFGYKHPQHFSRDFRKFFGVSPSVERCFRNAEELPEAPTLNS
jgi:transcriptional regulator GlxA family with amidase domain